MDDKTTCETGSNMLLLRQSLSDALLYLDNCINQPVYVSSVGDDNMPKINRTIMLNGRRHWIRANNEQEYAEKLIQLYDNETLLKSKPSHDFKEFALNWYEVYAKPNIETVTATTYKRQLTLYLIPAFKDMNIEDITTDDVQRLFNSMNGAKTTKMKTKMVLNMIMTTALEDGIISKNPLNSKRLKITGEASKITKEYSVEQMRFLIQNLDKVSSTTDRAYLAVQALHPLRLEEVLGLKWEDVDMENMLIHIQRAVTHPTRNQPEVKATKTQASVRTIGLSKIAAKYLIPGDKDDFVFGGSSPLSYTQVRKMCARIQRDTGFDDNITPIRFRTTVLTDIYDQTRDIKQAQAAAGHTTSAMTLKYYVKGRVSTSESANVIENVYGYSPDTQKPQTFADNLQTTTPLKPA